MLKHSCGYEAPLYCKKCGAPLSYLEVGGLFCPRCGRKVTMICPGCGKRW